MVRNDFPIYSLYKVPLQFQKFIAIANEKTGKWKLLRSIYRDVYRGRLIWCPYRGVLNKAEET